MYSHPWDVASDDGDGEAAARRHPWDTPPRSDASMGCDGSSESSDDDELDEKTKWERMQRKPAAAVEALEQCLIDLYMSSVLSANLFCVICLFLWLCWYLSP
jgi:hypothetical protein